MQCAEALLLRLKLLQPGLKAVHELQSRGALCGVKVGAVVVQPLKEGAPAGAGILLAASLQQAAPLSAALVVNLHRPGRLRLGVADCVRGASLRRSLRRICG